MGSDQPIPEAEIESLPTVRRQFRDFARTNPYANVTPYRGSIGYERQVMPDFSVGVDGVLSYTKNLERQGVREPLLRPRRQQDHGHQLHARTADPDPIGRFLRRSTSIPVGGPT